MNNAPYYTFPFNTCEIPNRNKNSIAQPYSVSINTITCIMIIYFILKSDNVYSTMFLASVFIFSLFHTLSHAFHIDDSSIQFLLTHLSAIVSSLLLVRLLQYVTSYFLNSWQTIGLLCLYLIDFSLIYYNVSHIYNILVFLVILFSIMGIFYKYTPIKTKLNIMYIIGFSCITLFFECIEVVFCQSLLQKYGAIPFHTLVELFGGISIVLLCNSFYTFDIK
jgi:hypothetical protein